MVTVAELWELSGSSIICNRPPPIEKGFIAARQKPHPPEG